MNDRYLYRAKRADNGEWIIGNLVYSENASIGYEYMIMPTQIIGNWSTVLKDTICQCTGLKDKNGKMIWENDILNSGNLVVTWREELASYCITKKGWMYQHFFGEAVDACDCEVIGNIFDNPELLDQ